MILLKGGKLEPFSQETLDDLRYKLDGRFIR